MKYFFNFFGIGKQQVTIFRYLFQAICLFAFLSHSAGAAVVWLIDPSATIEQGYDDNYFLDSNSSDEDEVWTTRLSGELALRGKSNKLDVESLLRLDHVNYSGDDDDLSDKDNVFLGLSSKYSASERNTFSLDGRYIRDTITRTEQLFTDPEDTIIGEEDEVGIGPTEDIDINLVDRDVRRERVRLGPGWNYRFTERTSGGLQYTYNDVRYSNDSGTGLEEFDNQKFEGNIQHRISETSRMTGLVSAEYFRPDDNEDVDTYEARLGLIRDFSETFQMNFSAGGRYSEFDDTAPGEDDDDTGFVANIGATKLAEKTRFNVNVERRVQPSGSGNQVETDRIDLGIRHSISEKLNFNLNAYAFETDKTNSGGSRRSGREFISIEPELNWQFMMSWRAILTYQYLNENPDDGGSADSNSITVGISYFPPRQF